MEAVPMTALPNASPPRHLLSIASLPLEVVSELFDLADRFAATAPTAASAPLRHKTVALMFFQPSTRTRLGFTSAAQRLGASVLLFGDVSLTRSVDYCDESLSDSVRVVGQFADAIVLRHFVKDAAHVASVSGPAAIVNAGDGSHEHPSQALADLWLLRRELGTLGDLRLGMVGDPATRVFRSLALGAALLGARTIVYQPPPGRCLPSDVDAFLRARGVGVRTVDAVDDLLPLVDAVCMMPFDIPPLDADPRAVRATVAATPERFRLTADKLRRSGPRVLVLHPGPRRDELDVSVDEMATNLYFRQVREGQFMRMAILAHVLG
jgi:aspartate carbamoyltransferase catalytic subunit